MTGGKHLDVQYGLNNGTFFWQRYKFSACLFVIVSVSLQRFDLQSVKLLYGSSHFLVLSLHARL